MAKKARRTFSKELKAKIAIEALKEHRTLAQLATEYDVHPNQISAWKKSARESLPEVFGTVHDERRDQEQLVGQLYEEIGRLKVELDWLKKKYERLG